MLTLVTWEGLAQVLIVKPSNAAPLCSVYTVHSFNISAGAAVTNTIDWVA